MPTPFARPVRRLTSEYVTPQTLIVTPWGPLDGATVVGTTVKFEWDLSVGSQSQYRLQIATGAGAAIVYDSQWTTSFALFVNLNLSAQGLRSNTHYWWRVFSVNTSGQEGETEWEEFLTAFPTSLNVTGLTARAVGEACGYDPTELPGVWLKWNAVAVPGTEKFIAYEVRRREAGETAWAALARITAASQTSYVDRTVKPYTSYQYAVVYYADNSTPQTLVSAIQSPLPVGMTRFDFAFVHSTALPSLYVQLPSEEGDAAPRQDVAYEATWGRTVPTAFVGEQLAHTITLRGLEQLRASPRQWQKVIDLYESQALGDTLCLRMGIDRERYFAILNTSPKSLTQKSWAATFAFQEVYFDEDLGYFDHTPSWP